MHEYHHLAGVSIDGDHEFFVQFPQERAEGVFAAIQVSGRQAQLSIVIARAGPAHQQDLVAVEQDAVDRGSETEPLGRHLLNPTDELRPQRLGSDELRPQADL